MERKSLEERIKDDFKSHEIGIGQATKLDQTRYRCLDLAQFLERNVPPGRELSTALTKLEEVMFHANAGIARHGCP
jgi:hypothetical protein